MHAGDGSSILPWSTLRSLALLGSFAWQATLFEKEYVFRKNAKCAPHNPAKRSEVGRRGATIVYILYRGNNSRYFRYLFQFLFGSGEDGKGFYYFCGGEFCLGLLRKGGEERAYFFLIRGCDLLPQAEFHKNWP